MSHRKFNYDVARELRDAGWSNQRLAEHFGVHHTTIAKAIGVKRHRGECPPNWTRPDYGQQVEERGEFFTLGKNGRLYRRSFDWETALDMYESGISGTRIAEKFGVTSPAVYRIVNPRLKERMDDASRKFIMGGTCEECGGTCTSSAHSRARKRPNWDGRVLCKRCRSSVMRTRFPVTLADDVGLLCSGCGETKPLSDFSPRARRKLAFGEALGGSRCRACETAARQAYRERHKIPCVSCGAPCLPPNEKGRRGSDTGLCRDCYLGRRELVDLLRAA